jgi:hypothetical protein
LLIWEANESLPDESINYFDNYCQYYGLFTEQSL